MTDAPTMSEPDSSSLTNDEALPDSPEAESVPSDPLAEALMDAARWKEVAMRSAAELDNYRKRMAREMQDAARYANAGLLESLLPVLDNFEYGLQAAKAENEKSNLYVGLSMVLKQIQDFLREQGVEEIKATGKFDPTWHEAVTQQPGDGVPEGEIISQTRKGYRLRDRLLRPAAVVVSSGMKKG